MSGAATEMKGLAQAFDRATGEAPRPHAMIDIEALGLKAGCVVHEIGVVIFNPITFEEEAQHHIVVDIHDAAGKYGLKVEEETLDWWEERGGPLQTGAESLESAMAVLDLILSFHKPELVWAKGKDFDFPLLAECFESVGVEVPWKYWQLKCSRDFVKLSGYKSPEEITHHALDDAMLQVQDLKAASEILGISITGEKLEKEEEAKPGFWAGWWSNFQFTLVVLMFMYAFGYIATLGMLDALDGEKFNIDWNLNFGGVAL